MKFSASNLWSCHFFVTLWPPGCNPETENSSRAKMQLPTPGVSWNIWNSQIFGDFFSEAKQKYAKLQVSRTWLSWLRRPARTRHNLCENFQIQQQQQISIRYPSKHWVGSLCGHSVAMAAVWTNTLVMLNGPSFSFWHYIRLKKRQHTVKRLRRKKKPKRTPVTRVFPIQIWLLGQSNYVENVDATLSGNEHLK